MNGVIRYTKGVTPKFPLEHKEGWPSHSSLSPRETPSSSSRASSATGSNDAESRLYLDIDVLYQFQPRMSHEIQDPSIFSKLFHRLRRFFRRKDEHKEDSDRLAMPIGYDIKYHTSDLY